MSVILGIDPGSRITGYGLIYSMENQLRYLDSGCIITKSKNRFHRLKYISNEICSIILKFQPKCLAIEQVFVGKNANSAIKLSQVYGVIIIAAIHHDITIFEYATKQVKQFVVGSGSAEKKHVQYMVRRLLKLNINLQIDASDALAIAITHSYVHFDNNQKNINI